MSARLPFGSKLRTERRRLARAERRVLYVFPEAIPVLAALAVLARWATRRHPDAKRQKTRKRRDLIYRRCRELKGAGEVAL